MSMGYWMDEGDMGKTGTVWSCGGGTQSAAIAVLILQGKIPKPDLSVIADTGREASETWEYFEHVLKPELEEIGVELHRLPHSFPEGPFKRPIGGWNTVDIFSGKKNETIIMPMFTNKSGIPGKLPKYCSNEWKTRPVDRFIKSKGFVRGKILIGFSIDEMERMRAHDPRQSWNHSYPLVDLRLTRADCIKLVEDRGWPTPPRSSCFMCPYRSDAEWLHIKNGTHSDFQDAVNLEKELQKHDENVYFHSSCEPLDEVDFGEGQEDMFSKPCASGMCFT
jgi:hypothetical protein